MAAAVPSFVKVCEFGLGSGESCIKVEKAVFGLQAHHLRCCLQC